MGAGPAICHDLVSAQPDEHGGAHSRCGEADRLTDRQLVERGDRATWHGRRIASSSGGWRRRPGRSGGSRSRLRCGGQRVDRRSGECLGRGGDDERQPSHDRSPEELAAVQVIDHLERTDPATRSRTLHLHHACEQREPRDRVDRVRAEEVRVDVPRRGQQERQAHDEPADGCGQRRDAQQRADADRDLDQRDRDPREHRCAREDEQERTCRVPCANPWSWVPTKSALPVRRKFGSRSFCAPANRNVAPRNPRRIRSAHGSSIHPSANPRSPRGAATDRVVSGRRGT